MHHKHINKNRKYKKNAKASVLKSLVSIKREKEVLRKNIILIARGSLLLNRQYSQNHGKETEILVLTFSLTSCMTWNPISLSGLYILYL